MKQKDTGNIITAGNGATYDKTKKVNMALELNIDGISVEEKKSRGYSIKIGNARICSVKVADGTYIAVCRSKDYADKFPADYKIGKGYSDSRNYYFYTARLTRRQLEQWVKDIIELGVDKRLDNR